MWYDNESINQEATVNTKNNKAKKTYIDSPNQEILISYYGITLATQQKQRPVISKEITILEKISYKDLCDRIMYHFFF